MLAWSRWTAARALQEAILAVRGLLLPFRSAACTGQSGVETVIPLRAAASDANLKLVIGEDFPAVLAAAQRGDEGAFTVLWRDGNPALLRYLKVIAPESAEDVTAETWVTVVRGLDRFRGGEDAWRAWLFTTARRRAVDAGRRRSRRPESPAAEVGEAHWPAAATVL